MLIQRGVFVFSYLLDAVVYYSAHFGVGSGPILLSNMRCSSPQLSLLYCSQKPEYNKFCTHHNDAGVKCSCKHKA